jgi:hypothetical protein
MPAVKFHVVSTGPVVGEFPFRCAHCGVETTARIVSHGHGDSFSVHGFGRDDELAMRTAYRDANRKALSALYRAPCLACGRLQPALEQRLPILTARAKGRMRRSVPIALVVAFVAFALACIPYRSELRTTSAVWLIAAGLAALCGGVAFLIAGWPVSAPDFKRPAPVAFWWNTPHGHGWVEAVLPSPAPHVPRYATVTYLLVGVGMAFGIGAMIAGWFEDVRTTRKVHVVLTAPERGPLIVRLDGKEVTRVAPTTETILPHDVAFENDRAAHRHAYRLEVERAREPGRARSFPFSPQEADRDWVVAPDAEASDFCLVAAKLVAVGRAESGGTMCSNASRSTAMSTRRTACISRFLHAPPERSASEEKPFIQLESSLRAVSCARLAEGTLLPYRERESRGPQVNRRVKTIVIRTRSASFDRV